MRLTRDEAVVLADALEERGDPRAALARAQLDGSDGAALIKTHWAEWVGALDADFTLLRWKWGQLDEVSVRSAPEEWTLDDLLRKPNAAFITRLAFAPGIPTVGVEQMTSLEHLVVFSTLEARELSVQSLTLSLDAATIRALPLLSAPRLTALHTRASAVNEASFFIALGKSALPSVQTWTHRLAAVENLSVLAKVSPETTVVLLCAPEAIPLEMKRALPRAQFVRLPMPARPRDPEDFHRMVGTHVVPTYAPTHFRELPAEQKTSKRSMQSDEQSVTTIGSGFSLDTSYFSTCGCCGSEETHGIYTCTWSLSSHFETTRYADWEYECRRCGLFTSMRSGRTS